MAGTNGKSSTISISNTRKITANKKNRSEKGTRADVNGSKPHSNGEDFSRSKRERLARKKEAKNNSVATVNARVKVNSGVNIYIK